MPDRGDLVLWELRTGIEARKARSPTQDKEPGVTYTRVQKAVYLSQIALPQSSLPNSLSYSFNSFLCGPYDDALQDDIEGLNNARLLEQQYKKWPGTNVPTYDIIVTEFGEAHTTLISEPKLRSALSCGSLHSLKDSVGKYFTIPENDLIRASLDKLEKDPERDPKIKARAREMLDVQDMPPSL